MKKLLLLVLLFHALSGRSQQLSLPVFLNHFATASPSQYHSLQGSLLYAYSYPFEADTAYSAKRTLANTQRCEIHDAVTRGSHGGGTHFFQYKALLDSADEAGSWAILQQWVTEISAVLDTSWQLTENNRMVKGRIPDRGYSFTKKIPPQQIPESGFNLWRVCVNYTGNRGYIVWLVAYRHQYFSPPTYDRVIIPNTSTK